MSEEKQAYLEKIPAVNDLLAVGQAQELIDLYTRDLVVEGIRQVTDELRAEILEKDISSLYLTELELEAEEILIQVKDYLEQKAKEQLVPAVNATGVVIHTNLGRSLLCSAAQEKLQQVASSYSTLEIERSSGRRGAREEVVEDLLTDLTGAEAGLVVNNNAAAVLLVLSVLCAGQEAVIARGQLVEIGGSFRIPEVMRQSGAELVEVGTTNRVHVADYRQAINEETGVLLKVHTSNYKIEGFSKEVSLSELVNLGIENELPVVEDLGSGTLIDLTDFGLSYEPTVQQSIAAGAGVVTFSGDKLLGGPQAGIIVGQAEYISRLKESQLTRALRVDKFTLGALEATLQQYRNLQQAPEKIPTLRMLTVDPKRLKTAAEKLVAELAEVVGPDWELQIESGISRVGGGALPVEELPTYVVKVNHDQLSAEKIAKVLRQNEPPIFTRIAGGAVVIDLRTLQPGDNQHLVEAVKNLSTGG